MWQKWWQVAWQVALIILISLAGNEIVRLLRLPIPGSVLGMLLLLALLACRLIRPEWVADGADWLLGEMVLFFVPAAVGVIQYRKLLAVSGIQLLIVIVVGTFLVMAVSGITVELLARRKGGKAA